MNRAAAREFALVITGFAALAAAMTFPLALHPASLARTDSGDGQFAVWNVAWVAHALLTDPLHVFDANIFYPHRWTLAYSDTNLGAGVLATPVYALTHDPFVAFNAVFLFSFVASGAGAYFLARRLCGDRRAGAAAGIAFAFCPFVLAHTPHIQLLMTAGFPLSLLAFHRMVDRPRAGRAVALGLVLAAQAYLCGYFAIFGVLAIGWMVLATAAWRRLWTSRPYWTAVGTAAVVSAAGALPLLAVFALIRQTTGFARGVGEAAPYSAVWRSFLTSGAYAHGWLWHAGLARAATDPLFPGFVVAIMAPAAFAGVRDRTRRETLWLYGGLAVLAAWVALGPAAGLYGALYRVMPGFTFMRAPGRVAPVFVLAAAILASLTIAWLLARVPRPGLVGALVAAATAAELYTPIPFRDVAPVPPVHRMLSTLPAGPVLELPVYSSRFAFARTQYMLNSTAHWMPLVDAYSDYIPQDFQDAVPDLAMFPNHAAFAWLRDRGVRYAVIHLDQYDATARAALEARIHEFQSHLARRYSGEDTRLYEIVGDPE